MIHTKKFKNYCFAQPLWKARRIITVGNLSKNQLHIGCTKWIWWNIFMYQFCIVNNSQRSHIAIMCLQENYSQHLQLQSTISSNGKV